VSMKPWIVYAVFDEKSRIPNQRLFISAASCRTRAMIWEAVRDLLDPTDVRHLIGVLDQYKSKWID
jgi:hypothetical protein